MSTNAGVNKVILLGEVQSEPTTKPTGSNSLQLSFIVGTEETIKKGRENIIHVEQHKVKVSRMLFREGNFTIQKGQMVYVEGKVETASYVDQDRVKRYDVYINASKVELLKASQSVAL